MINNLIILKNAWTQLSKGGTIEAPQRHFRQRKSSRLIEKLVKLVGIDPFVSLEDEKKNLPVSFPKHTNPTTILV